MYSVFSYVLYPKHIAENTLSGFVKTSASEENVCWGTTLGHNTALLSTIVARWGGSADGVELILVICGLPSSTHIDSNDRPIWSSQSSHDRPPAPRGRLFQCVAQSEIPTASVVLVSWRTICQFSSRSLPAKHRTGDVSRTDATAEYEFRKHSHHLLICNYMSEFSLKHPLS